MDFLLAKLHGIHSKSFLRENFNRLKKVNSIEALFKTLFPEEAQAVSVSRLYSQCEMMWKRKIFSQINYIATYFNYNVKLINALLLRYELDNVKLLVNAWYGGLSRAPELFTVDVIGTLDYDLIESSDISDKQQVIKILTGTVFEFLVGYIKEDKDVFLVENELDKFYYGLLLDSLDDLTSYEQNNLKQIIIEEMNWQNLSWAFRLKMFYKKSFANSSATFLTHPDLIATKDLESIYDLQFIAGEADIVLKRLPSGYLSIIKECYDKVGNFNLSMLEKKGYRQLYRSYTRYFFCEYFNILPVISFIFLKKKEYANIVSLIESIRYKFPLQDEEIV